MTTICKCKQPDDEVNTDEHLNEDSPRADDYLNERAYRMHTIKSENNTSDIKGESFVLVRCPMHNARNLQK